MKYRQNMNEYLIESQLTHISETMHLIGRLGFVQYYADLVTDIIDISIQSSIY